MKRVLRWIGTAIAAVIAVVFGGMMVMWCVAFFWMAPFVLLYHVSGAPLYVAVPGDLLVGGWLSANTLIGIKEGTITFD
jgi:hypothetical protein